MGKMAHGEDGAPPYGIDVSLDRNGNLGYTRVYEVCHVYSNRRRSRLHLPACVVWRLESIARGAVSGLAPEGMGGMANRDGVWSRLRFVPHGFALSRCPAGVAARAGRNGWSHLV